MSKDRIIEKFIIYRIGVENYLNKMIKMLRKSDRSDYVIRFDEICARHVSIREITTPYSPKHNDYAKRKNCILNEVVNAMLINFGLPSKGGHYCLLIIP